jgi:hypothetical protein
MASAVAGDPNAQNISNDVESELTKSFSSAEATAERYPQYASEIIAAAKTSFLRGDRWAYLAGIMAILIGGAIVFFLFPRKDEEEALLAQYDAEDMKAFAAMQQAAADQAAAAPAPAA